MQEYGPMTEAMYYILLALLQPGHGYGMMQRIRQLTLGFFHQNPIFAHLLAAQIISAVHTLINKHIHHQMTFSACQQVYYML